MNNNIKVCFVCPKAYCLFDPDKGGIFGGAEVDLYILGTSLAKDDSFEVSFVVGDYGQASEVSKQNIRLFKSLKITEPPLIAPFKIWRAMKKADADFYFIKTMSAGLLLVYLFCRINRRKLIIRTAHSSHCDGSYLTKHPFLRFLYKAAFKKAAAVFTQNRSDANSLKASLDVASITIPNGHIITDRNEQNKEYILWVARSANFKNPYLFIELAKDLPDQKFVMVCPKAFGDKNYSILKKIAGKYKNLEFVESVKIFDIQTVFSKAKIFVNTSESEGFANTFIQAAIAAVPIISYKVNPDDFLNKYNCGFCADGSYRKMLELINTLAEDEGLIKKYGENAFAYAKEKHDIQKILPQYKNLFKKIAGNVD